MSAGNGCSNALRSRLIRRLFVFVSLAAVASAPLEIHAQASLLREYQIKAAFLYNFIKFIDWPPDALPETSDTIAICVFSNDPFREALDSIKDKVVRGRRLVIQRIQQGKELGSCQVLVLGPSAEKRVPQVMQSLQGSSVLTVGDTERFVQSGGIINFLVEQNKVRFEINLNSAERARLKVSSQLLSLARVVRQ